MLFIIHKEKRMTKMESNLQNELNEAKSAFENNPSDLNVANYNEAREKLVNFLEVKTKGAVVRARARWHEHGTFLKYIIQKKY